MKWGSDTDPDNKASVLFAERAYAQNHGAQAALEQQAAQVVTSLALEMQAKIKGAIPVDNSLTHQGPIHIAASRTPYGHYSDAAGGAKKKTYEIK